MKNLKPDTRRYAYVVTGDPTVWPVGAIDAVIWALKLLDWRVPLNDPEHTSMPSDNLGISFSVAEEPAAMYLLKWSEFRARLKDQEPDKIVGSAARWLVDEIKKAVRLAERGSQEMAVMPAPVGVPGGA